MFYQRRREENQRDHGDEYGHDNGQKICERFVLPSAHDALIVGEYQHQNKDDGQQNRIKGLRKNHNLEEGHFGQEYDKHADYGNCQKDGVKCRSFLHTPAKATLEAEGFTHGIGCCQRKN